MKQLQKCITKRVTVFSSRMVITPLERAVTLASSHS